MEFRREIIYNDNTAIDYARMRNETEIIVIISKEKRQRDEERRRR